MSGVNKQHLLNALGNLFNASQRTNMTYQEHALCIQSKDVLMQFIEQSFAPKPEPIPEVQPTP